MVQRILLADTLQVPLKISMYVKRNVIRQYFHMTIAIKTYKRTK